MNFAVLQFPASNCDQDAVHVGKYLEIELAPGTDREAAHKALDDAAHKFLSNPVIEDYKLEITD